MTSQNVRLASATLVLCVSLVGCATGASSEGQQSFMQKCVSKAQTARERNECAWANASRMAGGR